MNINHRNRRAGRPTIDLRWAAALAVAAAAFSACGSDPPEREAAADAVADEPEQRPEIPAAGGIAFANSEEQEQERYDAEQRAALIQRAEASDRHLQTLADAAEQRARYEHIDHEADARAEAAAEAEAARERALQAQGSDQHLENLAEATAERERALQAQGSDQHLENMAEAGGTNSPTPR